MSPKPLRWVGGARCLGLFPKRNRFFFDPFPKRDVGSGTKWGRVMNMAAEDEDEQIEEIEKRAGDVEEEDFEEDTLEEVLTNLSITLTWMIIDCKSYQVVSKAF